MTDERMARLDAQYLRQSQWFAPTRSMLLRKLGIARKRRVLELGAGTGILTEELVRRCSGEVTAVDSDASALNFMPERFRGAKAIHADAAALPLPDGHFDLACCQMFFLWIPDVAAVIREVDRVLSAGGQFLIIAEPDYGGRIEHPERGAGLLLEQSLTSQRADPHIARRLPGMLHAAGFGVEAGLHATMFQPDDLTAEWHMEQAFLKTECATAPDMPAPEFLFMPYFWFIGRKKRT